MTIAAARRLWLHLGVVPTPLRRPRSRPTGITSDQCAPVPGMLGASSTAAGRSRANRRRVHAASTSSRASTWSASPARPTTPPAAAPPAASWEPRHRPRHRHHRRLVRGRRPRHLRPGHRLLLPSCLTPHPDRASAPLLAEGGASPFQPVVGTHHRTRAAGPQLKPDETVRPPLYVSGTATGGPPLHYAPHVYAPATLTELLKNSTRMSTLASKLN